MKKIITSLPFQLVLGLAAAWTKAERITGILEEFQKVVLAIFYMDCADCYCRTFSAQPATLPGTARWP